MFYNTAQSPDWYEGSIAMIATGIAMFFSVLSVVYYERRDKLRETVVDGVEEDGTKSVDGEVVVPGKALDV